MYAPPMFKPDRAASLALVERADSARSAHGTAPSPSHPRCRFTVPTTIFIGEGDNLTP